MAFRLSLLLVAASSAGLLVDADTRKRTPPTAVVQSTRVAVYRAVVVARYPHDPEAFTQGLLWHDGALFESTGRIGRSEIRKVDLKTGRVISKRTLPETHFGEGLALWKNDLVSLTWKNGTIHRWRLADLTPLWSSSYPFEGWGLAQLQDTLIASDGSSTLRALDPETYAIRRIISVTFNARPLAMLNELEVIDDLIFANVWMTNYVVAIDPNDGTVRRIVDLNDLAKQAPQDRDAVLNGIAWDSTNRRLFVTGKLWPWLYEVKLVPA